MRQQNPSGTFLSVSFFYAFAQTVAVVFSVGDNGRYPRRRNQSDTVEN